MDKPSSKRGLSHIEKVLNVWAIILLLWSVYRGVFKVDLGIWFDELIAKPLIFLYPAYYFIVNVEKKRFFDGISLRRRSILTDVSAGILVGVIFFVIGYINAGMKFTGAVSMQIIVIALAAAFTEEAIARGFVLTRLYDHYKNKIIAAILASVLFFIMRIPMIFTNPALVGADLVQAMVMNIVLSIIISLLFLERPRLLFAVAIHAMYILSAYLFALS